MKYIVCLVIALSLVFAPLYDNNVKADPIIKEEKKKKRKCDPKKKKKTKLCSGEK